jgi:hypothetical protein
VSAGKLNITIEQGATFRLECTWLVDDEPVNLTGYTARLQVRESHDSAEPMLDIDSDEEITLGGVLGTIVIVVDDEVTENLTAGNWVYDLELESPAGAVDRLLEGRAAVTPEVTR